MAQSQPPCALPNFAIDQGLEYYAGKSKLLDWVNRLLDLNLQRLEQLTSGAVYCQILDAFYADVVAIRKVNFLAREEYEILPNYKVLQAAFNALGFTKELDVASLSRASTSHLMEFTQWLYKSFNGVITVPNYNAPARRQMSLKGATNNIPFPACVVNSSFEFGRSDLRTSGAWATGTPIEATKSLPRSLRTNSNSNTPGTSGKSASKRSTPYVNVSSRYREGLAVPPDHYERRSPRLSPGSSGHHARQVHVSNGGTQTDFVDEEYRPMTAADVGTEAVSPRPSLHDFDQQHQDQGFGYEDACSRSESVASVSAASTGSPGQAPDGFSFGQQLSVAASSGALDSAPVSAGPSSQAHSLLAGRDSGEAAAGVLHKADRDVPTINGVHRHEGEEIEDALARVHLSGGEPPAAQSSREEEELEGLNYGLKASAGSPSLATEDAGAELPTAFGVGTASAAAGDGSVSNRAEPPAVESAEHGAFGSAAPTLSMPASSASKAAEDEERHHSTVSLSSANAAAAGPLSARETGGLTSARDITTSPAPASSAPSASPSPRTAPWRSSGTLLPADVASLLASPAARTRIASAACIRDMSAALETSTAALQAVDKSIDSYGTLLAGITSAAAASSSCSPALCGKARSLQDALTTVLAHTALLLSDVQSYSEATHPLPFSSSPSRGGAPAAESTDTSARQPESGSEGGAEGGKPPRNFAAEAAALLEVAWSHDTRLQALSQKAKDALQLPGSSETGSTGVTNADIPSGAVPASSNSGVSHRHLTDEQRKLCSTSLLDGHLKAVGMAQFALVQDIHKELAALTSTYFRHTGITGGGGASTGGGEGSMGGVSSTGGVSTSSNRKARVFKLGEYQLKQLRNGDIYKGRYVCNKKNGEGVYHFINADVYEGEFRDDRMDGFGVYTFSHEGRYEGQWRNAVYNGTGAETFAKGSTYHGEYAGGLRNGWGVCRFYNGDYYEGQWSKGLRDGSGMQQCTDDSNFVGDYHRGKRHGHGVYSFPNGDRYEGQYSEDLPHGYGTYHFASGQCYQGQWQQGKKHGWSVYTVDNGSRFMGLWSEGKPTWVQPLSNESTAAATDPASDESSRALRQAMEARDQAVQAAAEACRRAGNHWEVCGPVQAKLQTSLSQARSSATLSQQARRKACDLASRLDSAVALLQIQGAGAPVSSTTP